MSSVLNTPVAGAQTIQPDTESANEQADATEGLVVASSTQYTPDTLNEQIAVESTFTLTNEQPDEVVGSSVRSYFYTTWVIALPANVIDFAATSSGAPLATQIDPSTKAIDDADQDPTEPDPNANVVFGSITLPFNLNFGESVTLDVTYTIPGGEPRSEGPVARVNDSFLSFSVWAAGDAGLTDVRVAIPDGFSMDLQGDLAVLAEVERDGQRFLEAIGIEAPRMFFGQVFGRNDQGLITEKADLPGSEATVRAWPDDPDWASFVVDTIERDVPVIEDLTGLDWPAGNIEVIETVTPYLYGYGGWFNASSGLIEIGETLERDLILHELAHAWFNADLIDGRWITEGLAEEFASQTIAATSDSVAVPATPDQLNPDQPDLAAPLRVPLAAWASPWTLTEEDAFDYEQYHYNASWWVVRQITDDVGLDAFSEVLIALRNDELAYPGDGPIEQTQTPTRWTHFFDLLETRAGATGLDQLFRTYVLAPVDASLLVDRRTTLGEYAKLTTESQSWAAPLVVRRELTQWKFESANQMIDDAREIIALRDSVDELAASLGVAVTHQAEVPFETAASAADLDDARAQVQQLQASLKVLASARDEVDQQSSALGTVLDFPPMSLEQAQVNVQEQRSAIATVGELRAQVERRAADLGVTAPGWPAPVSSTSTAGFSSAASLAQARMATLDALEAATLSTNEPRGLIERIGLWRSDPDATLQSAVAHFQADELDDSLAAAARTETLLDTAKATGTRRLTWTGAILAIALLATFLISRRK